MNTKQKPHLTWWRRLTGKTYVLNKNKGEVHNLKNTQKNCLLHMMNNYEYITLRKAEELMDANGSIINGCAYCMKEYDTD